MPWTSPFLPADHPGSVPPRSPAGLRVEDDRDARDAERQVQEVIEDAVAVGQEPEQGRHDEAEQTDEQVDHPQSTDHASSVLAASLRKTHEGQQTARDQVDDVLEKVDV